MFDSTFEKKFDEALEAEWKRRDGESLKQAAKSLGYAIDELDKSADDVNEAMTPLLDTPEGDRLGAMLNDMEKMLQDLKEMQKEFEGRAEG